MAGRDPPLERRECRSRGEEGTEGKVCVCVCVCVCVIICNCTVYIHACVHYTCTQ